MTSSTSYIPLVISNDIRFKQGRKFLKEKKYEDAIDIFASLIETCIETYGEMSLESAIVHYEYGNTLLLKEEENPSNDLLGNVEEDKSNNNGNDVEEDLDDDDAPIEDGAGAYDDADDPTGGNDVEEEQADDLQIAWEVLDLARCYFSKEENANTNLFLSDIYMRLGDLMRFNSNISQSIEEYLNALSIREICCTPYDSMLSDVHFSLAVAYIYNAAEKDNEQDPLAEKMKALKHYQKSRDSILGWIVAFKDTAAEDEMLDKKELSDMLKETIDSLTAEIKEMQNISSSSSSTLNTGSSSTTTIGFGISSSNVSSNITSSNLINKSFTSSTTISSVQNPINSLQVKPKKRVFENQLSEDLSSNKK